MQTWGLGGDDGHWVGSFHGAAPHLTCPNAKIILPRREQKSIGFGHSPREAFLPLMALPQVTMKCIGGPAAKSLDLFQILRALVERCRPTNPQAMASEPRSLLSVGDGCQLNHAMDIIPCDGCAVLKPEQGFLGLCSSQRQLSPLR